MGNEYQAQAEVEIGQRIGIMLLAAGGGLNSLRALGLNGIVSRCSGVSPAT